MYAPQNIYKKETFLRQENQQTCNTIYVYHTPVCCISTYGSAYSPQSSHENEAFRKCSSTLTNLKTPALHFSVDGKYLSYRKRWRYDHRDIILPGLLEHKFKMTSDCWGFKFLQRSVNQNTRCVFRMQTPSVFKFVPSSARTGPKTTTWNDTILRYADDVIKPEHNQFLKFEFQIFRCFL